MDATTHPEFLTQTESPAPSNLRVAVQSILWVWAFYFVLNSVRMALGGAEHQFAMAERRVAVTLCGMALTWVFYLGLRRADRAGMGTRLAIVLTASVPVAFIYATVNYFAFYVVAPMQFWPDEMTHEPAKHEMAILSIVSATVEWYFFIAAWAAMYIALSSAAQAAYAEKQASLYRAEAQAAQLRALRYQLNPHFLFNTLNSLSTLVLRGTAAQAEQMIETLAAFLRATLTSDPTEDATLADEIATQRLYLDIEQVRFPDRLRVVVDVPDQVGAARVPSLLLQPLVENAIKYGVARTTRPVTITIQARAAADILRISVQDDGDGAGVPANAGCGVGLGNVSARLQARFGPQAGCSAGPAVAGGFRVALHMPLQISRVGAA
jgi:two-component system, LytTR family, sensor kinase